MTKPAWEQRLETLGVTLPPPPPPVANFLPARREGDILFVSGQGPIVDGQPVVTGSLGDAVTVEDGYRAARLCALNSLSTANETLQNGESLVRVVKVLAFVSSARSFTDQPKVVNGASDFFVEVFGDAGRHARSAIGTNVLPFDIAVEIEVAFGVERKAT